jgi:DnaK suppressor protein
MITQATAQTLNDNNTNCKQELNLAYFEDRLVNELKDLLDRRDCQLGDLKGPEENTPDVIDKASSLTDRSFSQNMCNRESVKIRKIEQALEDIVNGDYGICEGCGEDIAVRRLEANPIARHCIGCKTEIETRERLRRL